MSLARLLLIVAAGLAVSASAEELVDRCARLVEEAKSRDESVIRGKDDWLFLPSDLRHVAAGPFWGENAAKVSRARKPAEADPLPAILDFREGLAAHDIELVLVPVPPKALVHHAKLPGETATDPTAARATHLEFLKLLRESGLTVLDLLPELESLRADPKRAPYCRSDTHWAGPAIELAAEQTAKQLLDTKALEAGPGGFVAEPRTITIEGDLWRELEERPAQEQLTLDFIGTKTDAGFEPLASDPESPVLVLGDSHVLVFSVGADLHAKGAGLPEQLARRLGRRVDVLGVRGSGATPARISLFRKARRDPSWLAGKRAVVWCFTARELTQASGWRKVPVPPPPSSEPG
ncbi:MAG: hypothetical protein AAF533_01785 [Acidobacteriota bacterium]